MGRTKRAETVPEKKRRSRTIIRRLEKAYPGAKCALDHQNPLQLLIATILSAQCTDARVNQVTPKLFARYPDAKELARADRTEFEDVIRSTGFFRNKAKSIQGASQRIASDFGGQVPQTMEELVRLPGVARKTANVVLGTAFRIADGFVVDTHVLRLSHRMGLAGGKTPEQVEKELMALVPRKHWIDLAHILIHHGRGVCSARKPECERCVIESLCPKLGVAPRKPKEPPKPRRALKDRIAASKRRA